MFQRKFTLTRFVLPAVIALGASSTSLLADEVRLHAYDGSSTMTGELLGYDSTGYHLSTPLGELLVATPLVTCEGADCPSLMRIQSDLKATGYTVPDHDGLDANTPANRPHYCPETAGHLNNS